MIGGASTIQQCLNAGLCDELHLDIVPVLLGDGLRLFENIHTDAVRLQQIGAAATTPAGTGILFRVVG